MLKLLQRGPSHIHSKTIDCTPPHTLHHNGKRSLETHKEINIRTVPKTKPSELTTCVRVDSVRSPHKRLPRFSTVIKGGHKLLKHDGCLLRIELKEDLVHKLISGIIILPYIRLLYRGGFSFTYRIAGNFRHENISPKARANVLQKKFARLIFAQPGLGEIKFQHNLYLTLRSLHSQHATQKCDVCIAASS